MPDSEDFEGRGIWQGGTMPQMGVTVPQVEALGLGAEVPVVAWVDEVMEVPDLLGALVKSLETPYRLGPDGAAGLRGTVSAVGRRAGKTILSQRFAAQQEALAAAHAAEVAEFERHGAVGVAPVRYPGGKDGLLRGRCRCGWDTEFFEPNEEGEREAWGELWAHVAAAQSVVADPPPHVGSASGPIVTPGSSADVAAQAEYRRESPDVARRRAAEASLQKSFSPHAVGFGELRFEFNPLTGDVKVTSETGVLQVEPLTPGVALLRSHRREGAPGVTS